MKKLSVNQAINRGLLWVYGSTIVLFLGAFILGFYLWGTFEAATQGWELLIFALIFGFAALTMWIWWAFLTPIWKIWAFGNVRNVHELERKAIRQNLIYPDYSWINKTEIWTRAQRKKWAEIEQKFSESDIPEPIEEDTSIGETVHIYYSNFIVGSILFRGFGLILLGLFFSLMQNIWLGIAIIGYGAYLAYVCIPNFFPRVPQVSLSQEGISVPGAPLITWESIEIVESCRMGIGSSGSWSLEVYYVKPYGEEFYVCRIKVDNLCYSPNKIEKMARLFLQRHKQTA